MISLIKCFRQTNNEGVVLIFIAVDIINNHLLKDYFDKASLKFDIHQVAYPKTVINKGFGKIILMS
jgi:hypothetical protein